MRVIPGVGGPRPASEDLEGLRARIEADRVPPGLAWWPPAKGAS